MHTVHPGRMVDTVAVEELAARLHGHVTRPDMPGYDEARAVWNGMIDRYPALIAHCESAGDVATSIRFAREQQLPIAVRGGSHNVAGHATCDDGIVIDLTPMKTIEVDPHARIARAGAGVTWGELDAATQEHRLATPGGVFSDTGIAGLTLGGGFGWLRSKYGLSCDNLIAADVVTADGRLVHASETENSDLLWGLRGGGGNFGVVTTFEYRLHEVGPEVYFNFCFLDGEGDNTRRALAHYIDFATSAPDEVSTIAVCGIIPPVEDMFPADIHGRRFVVMAGMYSGPVAQGERILKPQRDFGETLIDFSGVMPYVEAQQVFDEDYPDGLRYYWKSLNLTRLDERAIDLIADVALRQASPLATTDLWHVGGAVRRVPDTASAFGGRQSLFLLNLEANWEDTAADDANLRWAREGVAALTEYSDGGSYVNFAGFNEEGDEMVRSTYGTHHQRLVELKTKYDPDNIFRLNSNIKPASVDRHVR
jgi:hypothetical protein